MAKSKNHSVRFEQEEFDFICKRQGLKTAQRVVSFLMGEYMKLYRVEKKSVFAVENKESDVPGKYSNGVVGMKHPEGFTDRVALNRVPISFDEPEEPKRRRTFNEYVTWKREILGEEEYARFCGELEEDENLTDNQKILIKRV